MKEQIRVYLDNLFQDAPHTAKAVERKGQVFNDLSQRYDELIYQGNDPQTAYNIVIQSVSNVPALFEGLDHEDARLSENKPVENEQIDFPQQNYNNNKKERNFHLFPALLVSLVLIGLVCAKQFFMGDVTNLFNFDGLIDMDDVNVSDDLELVDTMTLPMDGVEEINIELINSDINVCAGTTDDFVVEQYTNYGKDEEMFQIKKDGEKLEIKQKSNLKNIIFGAYKKIKDDPVSIIYVKMKSKTILYVPAAFYKNEAEYKVSTVSGNISIDKCYGDLIFETTSGTISADQVNGDVRASTTSGRINLGDVTGDIDAGTTSGDITVEKCVGDFNGDTVSGEINVKDITGFVEADTTSGSVNVYQAVGGIDVDTVSGSCMYNCKELTDDIEYDSTSGSIEIILPEGSNIDYTFDSVSGCSNTYFSVDNKQKHKENATVGHNGNVIDIDTITGRADVRLAE